MDATRSAAAMTNETAETAPPITPDATDREAIGSELVCTVKAPPAVGVLLMVRPVSVTVTSVLATRDPKEVVITIRVAE